MKRNRFMMILLALVMVAATCQMSFAAADYSADGGSYSFNGKDIVATGSTSINDIIDENLEPGDSVDIVLTYTNDSKYKTEWYLENEVIETLETASNMNGGYTYILTNSANGEETEIFNSDQVGGEDREAGTGLEQATNATKAEDDQDYFFVAELAPKASGTTTLTVALDGESQINTYRDKNAEIKFSYAVEVQEENTIVNKIIRRVNTGDETKILIPIVCFLAALVLLIIAILVYKKERKDGGRA